MLLLWHNIGSDRCGGRITFGSLIVDGIALGTGLDTGKANLLKLAGEFIQARVDELESIHEVLRA